MKTPTPLPSPADARALLESLDADVSVDTFETFVERADVAAALLALGLDRDSKTECDPDWSLLTFAVGEQAEATALTLVHAGASLDPDVLGLGHSLLFEALEMCCDDLIEELIARGERLDAVDDDGVPLFVRAARSDAALMRRIIEAQRPSRALAVQAAEAGLADYEDHVGGRIVVDLLVDAGYDLVSGPEGADVLWSAAFALNAPAVERLLALGADPNQPDSHGSTPVERARRRRTSALALLGVGA